MNILVEDIAFSGVKKIAEKFTEDFKMVFGETPAIVSEKSKLDNVCIVFATLGKSNFLDDLPVSDKIEIKDKRESFQSFFLIDPIPNVSKMILVVGSDKRGTIYGIFDLSEQIGVTPLVYFGDATPFTQDKFVPENIRPVVSKEPSVKYRGFFINDEWPCFGNWTFSHFGGFTAQMYDKVFEFLLRMKGNCLWPAMWSSSFALDGPGSLNEELADEYGVIINYSHHEPCLRASEEWDIYKGDEYGTEWNYSTNKEGLLKYWADGLKRSGKYENIVTMGMRGERDSKMLGVNTLQDSIDFWKDIIVAQDELITKYADTKDYVHPRMIAIYKEVEDYFYGDENTKGLEGWEKLDDIMLMFCEDNFGFMRKLPEGAVRNHKGGLGMYYHLDYHGDPISYEWINSTQNSKIWEQMTTAYEFGIRDMWMVNVGDLKGNEVPLYYFMSLAYDYEKWGISNIKSGNDFTKEWTKKVFLSKRVADIYTKGVDLISHRKPEALNPHTYKEFLGETDLVIKKCTKLLEEIEAEKKKLPKEVHEAYFSMIEYPLSIGLNNMLINLYSGKNERYAYQGKIVANKYKNLVSTCYEKEENLKAEFISFKGGKWDGMELASHLGFTKWNEDGAKKPLRFTVEPLDKPHMVVSVPDSDRVAVKNYGSPDKVVVREYYFKGKQRACVEVANDGVGAFTCKVINDNPLVVTNWSEKEITDQENLYINYSGDEICQIKLTDGDTTVIVELQPELERVSILASEFTSISNNKEFSWEIIPNYGKYGSAVKMFPIDKHCDPKKSPKLGYSFNYGKAGQANIVICLAPTSPLDKSHLLRLGVVINGRDLGLINTVEDDYKAGTNLCLQWAKGVLEQERRILLTEELLQGQNEITLYGVDPGLVVEKLMIYEGEMQYTYFGY